jgi:hypothetical protein
MIFKKYGDSYQSVEPNFDSKALNEVAFRRDRSASFPVAELASRYEPVATHELVAQAEGAVQDETEAELLTQLALRLGEVVDALPPGGIAIVENELGHDYPKTRQKISNVVVSGENRLHFHYTLDPALRVSVHRPRG